MKKLTELDFQLALDECTEKRFRSHGAWLAGMVKRLNAVLGGAEPERTPFFTHPGKYPTSKTVIKSGNNTEPEVPCIS